VRLERLCGDDEELDEELTGVPYDNVLTMMRRLGALSAFARGTEAKASKASGGAATAATVAGATPYAGSAALVAMVREGGIDDNSPED
jgi:hypothetical protein